jgi:hypothetical protein
MRAVKGLGLLAALTIALGLVGAQPGRAAAYTTPQVAIRNLANANVGRGPCTPTSQGGYFTAPDGATSCAYPTFWCGEFTAWVWDKSGHVYITSVGHTPTSIEHYGEINGNTSRRQAKKNVPPLVGDAVIFSSNDPSINKGSATHVGIVYYVDPSSHIVTVIAGNEGKGNGSVGVRTFDYSTLAKSSPTTQDYWAYEYVTPRTH